MGHLCSTRGRTRFSAGKHILKRGDIDPSVFILLEGRLSVEADEAGTTQIAELHPGDVFGEMSFFDNAPRNAFVRALDDCRAFRLSRERFDYLSAWEPAIARQFIFDLGASLSSRLRWTTDAYLELKLKPKLNSPGNRQKSPDPTLK